ncbi:MAG TPA: hypothetical protein VFU38_03995 [Candidatus Krumholzibacteria bacterium]|nr:hypothetical protein [Candidatus Krumholzibacteria bacterium]
MIDRPKRVWLLGAAVVAAVGVLVGGCDDEKTTPTENGTSTPIQMETIIASPKAGSPGDTLLLSAIVTSSSPNEGDIPVMAWTATGGAFLEDDQSSVRWVAPENGIYQITARATNDVNSVSSTANVFVGESSIAVSERGGTVRLQANGADFYYSRSSTNPANGAEAYSVVGIGDPTDAVLNPPEFNGSNNHGIAYAADVSFEAHSVDSLNPSAENVAKHLYMGDFATQAYIKISNYPQAGERFPVFTDPNVSPDSRFIAFGGMLPTFSPTQPDTFDIFVYDTETQSRRNVTQTHTNRRNALPTWSTNLRWLTFISDRSARNAWDLYGLPATNGVVDEAPAGVVRLLNSGGTLITGTIDNFDKPLMDWNPVSPMLAVLAGDALYIVTTTQSGASQIEVPVTAPVDMKWSPDGAVLAASTGAAVMTIETDGTSTVRVSREGDTFADLAWTADSAWLIYRATRGSTSWLEAYDVDQSQFNAPIAITGGDPHTVGNRSLGEYRLTMSIRPAVGSIQLVYPTFTGSSTVGIRRLDISGLSP